MDLPGHISDFPISIFSHFYFTLLGVVCFCYLLSMFLSFLFLCVFMGGSNKQYVIENINLLVHRILVYVPYV